MVSVYPGECYRYGGSKERCTDPEFWYETFLIDYNGTVNESSVIIIFVGMNVIIVINPHCDTCTM